MITELMLLEIRKLPSSTISLPKMSRSSYDFTFVQSGCPTVAVSVIGISNDALDQWSGFNHLCDLATDGARDGLGGVHVGEEALGVVLDLLDVEAEAVVLASGGVGDTGDEAVLAARDAADGAADVLANLLGVGEGDARRTGLALDGLVDVGGSVGGGLVVALEAGQGDVVADDVLLAVDAELVQALGALEATGVLVLGIDDLVGSGDDLVGGGEVERRLLGDWRWC